MVRQNQNVLFQMVALPLLKHVFWLFSDLFVLFDTVDNFWSILQYHYWVVATKFWPMRMPTCGWYQNGRCVVLSILLYVSTLERIRPILVVCSLLSDRQKIEIFLTQIERCVSVKWPTAMTQLWNSSWFFHYFLVNSQKNFH